MSEAWRDYERHYMTQGTTKNVTFHADAECRKIKHPEKVVDRPESFLAFHAPEPCEVCHDDVEPTTSADCSPKKYLSLVGGGD